MNSHAAVEHVNKQADDGCENQMQGHVKYHQNPFKN